MTYAEQRAHAVRGRRILVRPLFLAAIALTLFGNLSQAQPSWGGWLSHGWAPVAYLLLVELLVFDILDGGWAVPVRVGIVVLAAVAFVISYSTLRDAAIGWGWSAGMAWLFPLIVDLVAVLMTFAQLSVTTRLRNIEQAERDETETVRRKGGRPKPEPKSEPARSDPGSYAERIILEHGTEPNAWPGPTALAEAFGISKSTASTHRRKAAQMVTQVPA